MLTGYEGDKVENVGNGEGLDSVGTSMTSLFWFFLEDEVPPSLLHLENKHITHIQ